MMKILAIDTSCDDTCIAILKIKNKKSKIKSFEILSNIVSSQIKIHQKYGGVYPTLAKREHQKNLVPVLKKALKKAGLFKKSKRQSLNIKSDSKTKTQTLKKILKREEILYDHLKEFFIN